MSTTTSPSDVQGRSIQANLDSLESLFAFLAAVPDEINDHDNRIQELETRFNEGLRTVEQLQQEYEAMNEALNEAERGRAKQQEKVETLRSEVDDLRDDMEAVRGLFSGRVLDKEDAHVEATHRDATQIVEVGDTQTVVIDDTDYADPRDTKAIAHIEGLVIFVPAPNKALSEGDKVKIRISDVADNHAHSVRVDE